MARRRYWLEPKIRYPKRTPSNWEDVVTKRLPIHLNPNVRRCTAIARSTGLKCQLPAVTGAQCCRMHGGLRWAVEAARKADSRAKAVVRPKTAETRYACSVALSEAVERELDLLPKSEKVRIENLPLGARGRARHAALRRLRSSSEPEE
jgi:hypothetical protein